MTFFPDSRDSQPCRLLAEAAKGRLSCNFDACAAAVARGAGVNEKDSHGWTALHHAAWDGNDALAGLLAANGAEIDARARNGVTPLLLAAQFNRVHVARILLQSGADPDAADAHGETPRSWAQRCRAKAVLGLFKKVPEKGAQQSLALGNAGR